MEACRKRLQTLMSSLSKDKVYALMFAPLNVYIASIGEIVIAYNLILSLVLEKQAHLT